MIKVIIFDMMGPLLQKRPDYLSDPVVQTAEKLSSEFLDAGKFISELKTNEATKDFSVEEIAKRVANKYSPVLKVWEVLLPKLKKKYRLAVLNNGMSITIPYFKQAYPFQDYFEVFVNSAEENLEKPAPNIYLLVCQKLGVTPSECVFIDDTEENVEGARKVGMEGILWKDYESLVNQLHIFHRRWRDEFDSLI